jgi:hypothetical protein
MLFLGMQLILPTSRFLQCLFTMGVWTSAGFFCDLGLLTAILFLTWHWNAVRENTHTHTQKKGEKRKRERERRGKRGKESKEKQNTNKKQAIERRKREKKKKVEPSFSPATVLSSS